MKNTVHQGFFFNTPEQNFFLVELLRTLFMEYGAVFMSFYKNIATDHI